MQLIGEQALDGQRRGGARSASGGELASPCRCGCGSEWARAPVIVDVLNQLVDDINYLGAGCLLPSRLVGRLQRGEKGRPVGSHQLDIVLCRRLALVGLFLVVPEPNGAIVLVPQRHRKQIAKCVGGDGEQPVRYAIRIDVELVPQARELGQVTQTEDLLEGLRIVGQAPAVLLQQIVAIGGGSARRTCSSSRATRSVDAGGLRLRYVTTVGPRASLARDFGAPRERGRGIAKYQSYCVRTLRYASRASIS